MTLADTMQLATRLTREGRLAEATRAIRAALGGHAAPGARAAHGPDAEVIQPWQQALPFEATAPRPAPAADATRPASFAPYVFDFAGSRHPYRVYEPPRSSDTPLPVVVMLHGCKQDSGDFARGTAMNDVAAREGCIVLYPEQLRAANTMGCWNWFEPAHQRRDAGEPALLAALVRHVVATHGGDASRVYVAGLSAGGAMASVLGERYPDVFAAVGVHSGLPTGSAHDVTSAFRAMRNGPAMKAPVAGAPAIPTIVFHGTADKTVTRSNGDAVLERQRAAHARAGVPLEPAPGGASVAGPGRSATRQAWADAQGRVRLEGWTIAGGPHAWSGGRADGSFTDPAGPSASEAMVRFFLRHRLP